MDEELKTCAAVLGVMTAQAERAEHVLTALAAKINEQGLALALTSHAKTLRLAAEEAQKLVELLRTRA